MYDIAVKMYGNGTIQMIAFRRPIYNKEDRPPKKERLEEELECMEWEDELETPWGDDVMRKLNDRELDKARKKLVVYTPEELERRHEDSIRSAFGRTKRAIYDYGRNNKWDWFFTFTLDSSVVKDRSDYKECSAKVRKWLNNIQQRKCPDMKYLVVPELHVLGGWHFHALVSDVDDLTFDIAVNNQEYRKSPDGRLMLDAEGRPVRNKYYGGKLRTHYPDGDYIYNIRDYKNGWSTATRIKDTRKAVGYIVKYITKDLCNVASGCRRYYPSRNLTLPERVTYSGYGVEEIIQVLEESTGLELNRNCTKEVTVQVDGYENVVTYYEFE